MKSNTKGFTLLEILVAVAISAIGFLAMSQMQYLSLKQKTIAEFGTFSTNILETVSDLELANARRISLLNARVYLDSQAKLIILSQDDYCDGSDDAVCEQCPCNPLDVFVSDGFDMLAAGTSTEFTCAPVDPDNFDPFDVEFFTEVNDCETVPDIFPEFYILRRVVSNFNQDATPNQINMNITYVLKTANQFNHQANRDEMGSGAIGNVQFANSLTVQNFQVSAHVERDWTNFIELPGGSWNEVIVPHVP